MKSLVVISLLFASANAFAALTCVATLHGTHSPLQHLPGSAPAYAVTVNGIRFVGLETGIAEKSQQVLLDIQFIGRKVDAYFSLDGGTLEDSAGDASLSCH